MSVTLKQYRARIFFSYNKRKENNKQTSFAAKHIKKQKVHDRMLLPAIHF